MLFKVARFYNIIFYFIVRKNNKQLIVIYATSMEMVSH